MSKKHYFLISGFIIISLVGLVWSVLRFMEPRAIPKVKWSAVKSEYRIRDAILHILKQPLSQAQFVLIGVPSNEPKWLNLVSLILQKAMIDKKGSQVWVTEELSAMREKLPDIPILTFEMSDPPASHDTDLGKVFHNDLKGSHFIVTGLVDALSFNEESRGGWLRANHKESVHLVFSDAILNREEEKNALIPCDTSGKKFAVGRLGCEILSLSRMSYRKIRKTLDMGFATSQISERDYLTVIKFGPNQKEGDSLNDNAN